VVLTPGMEGPFNIRKPVESFNSIMGKMTYTHAYSSLLVEKKP
jgi:hypothetical protein